MMETNAGTKFKRMLPMRVFVRSNLMEVYAHKTFRRTYETTAHQPDELGI